MTVKNVRIEVPLAVMGNRAGMEYINHHCPFCNDTMDWKTFKEHLPLCIEENENDE